MRQPVKLACRASMERGDWMYKKIWGLQQLERMKLPFPPYKVIDIAEVESAGGHESVLEKIRQVGIPNIRGDRVGVTIRVSMPGSLDKVAKHGGLHVVEEREVLRKVLERYERYERYGKIIVQHTVDARCSGAVLKEKDKIIIEAIPGDAPPLLEGETSTYEKWVYSRGLGSWKKERNFFQGDAQVAVLTTKDLNILHKFVEIVRGTDVYLEWSIAKNGKPYFYEYSELKKATLQ